MARFIKLHVFVSNDDEEIEDLFQPSFLRYRGLVLINTETILSVERSGYTFWTNVENATKKAYPELELINDGDFSTIKLTEGSITVLESFESLCEMLLED